MGAGPLRPTAHPVARGASPPAGSHARACAVVTARPPSAHAFAYALSHEADVSLAVYDLSGRRRAVVDDGRRPAGTHEVVWNAAGVPPGVYFVRLRAGGVSAARTVFVTR